MDPKLIRQRQKERLARQQAGTATPAPAASEERLVSEETQEALKSAGQWVGKGARALAEKAAERTRQAKEAAAQRLALVQQAKEQKTTVDDSPESQSDPAEAATAAPSPEQPAPVPVIQPLPDRVDAGTDSDPMEGTSAEVVGVSSAPTTEKEAVVVGPAPEVDEASAALMEGLAGEQVSEALVAVEPADEESTERPEIKPADMAEPGHVVEDPTTHTAAQDANELDHVVVIVPEPPPVPRSQGSAQAGSLSTPEAADMDRPVMAQVRSRVGWKVGAGLAVAAIIAGAVVYFFQAAGDSEDDARQPAAVVESAPYAVPGPVIQEPEEDAQSPVEETPPAPVVETPEVEVAQPVTPAQVAEDVVEAPEVVTEPAPEPTPAREAKPAAAPRAPARPATPASPKRAPVPATTPAIDQQRLHEAQMQKMDEWAKEMGLD
ncbi:hypothetical protein ACOPJQ_08855 [Luteimonas dalianensis]|uniref:hypothetical protein n=1 Tax=Luteimonas dalianensis TaxID=1148196 RepID=UPI003BF37B89